MKNFRTFCNSSILYKNLFTDKMSRSNSTRNITPYFTRPYVNPPVKWIQILFPLLDYATIELLGQAPQQDRKSKGFLLSNRLFLLMCLHQSFSLDPTWDFQVNLSDIPVYKLRFSERTELDSFLMKPNQKTTALSSRRHLHDRKPD